jgi:hypothetical protein
VFLLDEMQFLGVDDLRLLATVFHGLQQRTAPVLLAAAGLPQLPLLLTNARPYTERLFHYRDIGSVGEAAARAALAVPAERRGSEYEPEALRFIVIESGGYPYFIQQWGETVWNEAEGPVITLDDAHATNEIVNDELDRRFFRDRYDEATEMERMYMAAMADLGDGPHTSRAIAERMERTPKSMSVARDGLLKKGSSLIRSTHRWTSPCPNSGATCERRIRTTPRSALRADGHAAPRRLATPQIHLRSLEGLTGHRRARVGAPLRAWRRHADEAERLVADGFEAVKLVAGDVDDVARADLVGLVAEGHAGAAALDDDAVIVGVVLARGAHAGLDVEVPHAIAGGADDEVVALDARQVVRGRLDVVPGALGAAVADEPHRGAHPTPTRWCLAALR